MLAKIACGAKSGGWELWCKTRGVETSQKCHQNWTQNAITIFENCDPNFDKMVIQISTKWVQKWASKWSPFFDHVFWSKIELAFL